ncbi:SDR family oxidoreductase [Ensifer adhaerens]|uniref:SDR family oxidoreductase n=1 Tax=Ensifer canadensis TaxID=555315 RepID=UPI0014902CBE|nr:SDR family oxidoreductase [Ensifer canadensis]NOV21241.1 SDR family oxidoreductase [Ensifer canadensis]
MSTANVKKTALVLGGSKGLGFGVAEALADKGVDVALVGRDEATLRAAEAKLEGKPGVAVSFSCDLLEKKGVSELLGWVDRHMGKVDILLLNGGGPPPFPASKFEEEIWLQQFGAMFLNQVRIASHFLPGMRARKFGRIVAVSSTSVKEPISGLTASNALRSALAGWAKTLSLEVAADGVTVNVVLPGRFATERTVYFDTMDAADRGVDPSVIAGESQAEIPIGRYGTHEEFGAVVAFLASDEARYVTGVAMPVDGGLSRSML